MENNDFISDSLSSIKLEGIVSAINLLSRDELLTKVKEINNIYQILEGSKIDEMTNVELRAKLLMKYINDELIKQKEGNKFNYYSQNDYLEEYSVFTPFGNKRIDFSKSQEKVTLFRADNVEYNLNSLSKYGTSCRSSLDLIRIKVLKALNGSDINIRAFWDINCKYIRNTTRETILTTKTLGTALLKYCGLGDEKSNYISKIRVYPSVTMNIISTNGVRNKLGELYNGVMEKDIKIDGFVLDTSIKGFRRYSSDSRDRHTSYVVGANKDSIVVLGGVCAINESNSSEVYVESSKNNLIPSILFKFTAKEYIATLMEYVLFIKYKNIKINSDINFYIQEGMERFIIDLLKVLEETITPYTDNEENRLVKFYNNIKDLSIKDSRFCELKKYISEDNYKAEYDSIMSMKQQHDHREDEFIKLLSKITKIIIS